METLRFVFDVLQVDPSQRLTRSLRYFQNQDPAIQRALAEQQQKHERQLLEMQRQIALLSRRNAVGPGGAPAPGTGGTWQGPSDGGAF